MTFNEWWVEFRGFDAEDGKEGMAYCWNSALDEAEKNMQDAITVLDIQEDDKATILWATDLIIALKNDIAINRN